jgi:Ala-tRNA(Pro) deacylase
MTIARRLAQYLEQCGARYEVCTHPHSSTSAESARLAHVPQHQLAKSVILEDDAGIVMAVVPADSRVRIGELARLLQRHDLHLADEQRISQVFDDCAAGAVPAIGMAYGVETVVEEELQEVAEVYVEGGDHQALLRLSGETFGMLMRPARHAHFCRRLEH